MLGAVPLADELRARDRVARVRDLYLAPGVALGCDLRRDTCAAKFGNLLNFGGFPDIPGRNPFGGGSIL